MAASATACVDAPPTYTAPEQSTPAILGTLVVPPTFSVVTIKLGTPQPLTVPFRSIDAGEGLTAILWHDLVPGLIQKEMNEQHYIGGSSFADDSRALDEQQNRVVPNLSWEATPAGCRTVTLRLAHTHNYPTIPEAGIYQPGHLPPKDPNDIAEVTWFFDVQDPNVDPSSRPICWGTQ